MSAIQLHGDESVAYINELRNQIEQSRNLFKEENKASKKKRKIATNSIEIIKVFSVDDSFDFDALKSYEAVVDYFLFDTKGKERGGNGVTFDWRVLEKYPSTKPYFLSGGIGLAQQEDLQTFLQKPAAKFCYAIDVNSQFETKAGEKSVEKIKKFKSLLVEGLKG